MEPTEFFIWDDLIDPGKEYQCPNSERLMDGSYVARSEEDDCLVCQCPDCGTLNNIDQ